MFLVDGVGDFKFGRQIDRSKSLPTHDKTALKGVWSGHVDHFNFGPQGYLNG